MQARRSRDTERNEGRSEEQATFRSKGTHSAVDQQPEWRREDRARPRDQAEWNSSRAGRQPYEENRFGRDRFRRDHSRDHFDRDRFGRDRFDRDSRDRFQRDYSRDHFDRDRFGKDQFGRDLRENSESSGSKRIKLLERPNQQEGRVQSKTSKRLPDGWKGCPKQGEIIQGKHTMID